MVSNFLSSLYILEIRHLSEVVSMKIFSHSVGCHFVLFTMSFALLKLFSFRRSHCCSQCRCYWFTFRKWFPVLMRSSVLPTFSSMRFSVVGFILRSLIHSDLSFVHGSIFILLHIDIQLCQHHLLNMLSFSILYFLLLCQKSDIDRCVD